VIDLEHPSNRGIIAYLRSRSPAGTTPQQNPGDVEDPYYKLGTHPEIVERLWDELGGALPAKCAWILHGSPVLAHPRTGVVFGFGGGSLTYALRLPPAERGGAINAGAKTRHDYPAYPELHIAASSLDLAAFGNEWIFGAWLESEREWCIAAFEYAADANKIE
jgi:hypothetical protein